MTSTTEQRLDRTPPNNIAAERVVLGAMMLSPDAIADVIEILKPADYYRPANGSLHSAIVDLYSRGEPTDPVAVAAQLLKTEEMGRVGGVSYLHDCISEVFNDPGSAAWHARKVFEAAGRRRLIEAGGLTLRLAQDPGVELTSAIDQAGAALLEATTSHDGGELELASEMIDEVVREIHEAGQRGGGMQGLSTGFADLDRLLNGLKGGQFVVIAGRPGMGKSVLGVDIARINALHDGRTVAMFSLEMSKNELLRRVIAAEGRIPLHAVTSGQMSAADTETLGRIAGRIKDSRGLRIDDSPMLTITDIRARARRIAQRGPLDLIIVDYLQLLSPSGKRVESRQQEVADMSRGLKLLAKELDIPVIAIAQLNRGVEQRQDKRPQLSDLRESGALEQDADIVLLVHRDDYYDDDSPRRGEADFIVAKHRGGPTDTVTVAAQLHLARFADMALI